MYSRTVVNKFTFSDVDYYEYEDLTLNKPSYMVLGLPDAGLVGALATKYLATTTSMELFGEIDSPKYLQPITVVHKSVPRSPLQLYINSSKNILALVSEAPLPIPAVYPISKSIVEYATRKGIDYIISLSGIAVPNRLEIKKLTAYWLASTDKAADIIKDLDIKSFDEGFIVGPYAVILKESRRRGINNLMILIESFYDFPDPEAAAEALQILSKITGVSVDVSKLLEEAELLKIQTRELMKQTRKALSEMKKKYEMQMPLMYT